MDLSDVGNGIVPVDGTIQMFKPAGSLGSTYTTNAIESAVENQRNDSLRITTFDNLRTKCEPELRHPYQGLDATRPTSSEEFRGYPKPFFNFQPYRRLVNGFGGGGMITGTMGRLYGDSPFVYYSLTIQWDVNYPCGYYNDLQMILWRSTNPNPNLGTRTPMVSTNNASYPFNPHRTVGNYNSGKQSLSFTFPCTGNNGQIYWWFPEIQSPSNSIAGNKSWFEPSYNSILNTATNLVFQPSGDGTFEV